MDVKSNLNKIAASLPPSVTLVAVSKTKPSQAIADAYETGHRDYGENKVQELTAKSEELPKDIKWHLIGHLQRNKVKYIAPFVYLIHTVDSLRLAKEINKRAKQNNRVIKCLIQIYIANEDTKFGLDFNEANELFESEEFQALENIEITGLMGMATFTDNKDQIRTEFASLKEFYDQQKEKTTALSNCNFDVLSMGMSGDYEVGIEEGSNMIRIGSSIFGARH